MPRRRTRGIGIRARTTLAAGIVVAGSLAIGALALSLVLDHSLTSDIDQVAELRANDIALLASAGRLPPTISADEDEAVQVLDARGNVIASTANVAGRPLLAHLSPTAEGAAAATIDGV